MKLGLWDKRYRIVGYDRIESRNKGVIITKYFIVAVFYAGIFRVKYNHTIIDKTVKRKEIKIGKKEN